MVRVYDRLTGDTFLSEDLNAREIVERSGFRYGIGEVCPKDKRITLEQWVAHTGVPEAAPAAPAQLAVMAGSALPMPGETVETVESLKAKIAELEAKQAAPNVDPVAELDAPHEDAGGLTTRELNADLEAAGIEIDPTDAPADKVAKLSEAQEAALDRDGDGKAGGSKPKAKRTPEEEAERVELIASLREKGIPVFMGWSNEQMKAKLAA